MSFSIVLNKNADASSSEFDQRNTCVGKQHVSNTCLDIMP